MSRKFRVPFNPKKLLRELQQERQRTIEAARIKITIPEEKPKVVDIEPKVTVFDEEMKQASQVSNNKLKKISCPEHNDKYTKEELIEMLVRGKEALVYIHNNYNNWGEIVNESDQAIGDIRHYVELNYPEDAESQQLVCELIRDYSKRRRMYKDMQCIFESVLDINKDIYEKINKVKTVSSKQEAGRVYRPRVLNELFE